ncbi:hypothetical protein Tco_1186197 [Tanacetum coccineum]
MWADPTTLRTPVGAAEKPHAPLMGGVDGGVVAAVGDDNGAVRWRVKESDGGDRIDREMGRIFGVGRKSSPENFSGGCGGGRRWLDAAGDGDGGGWPVAGIHGRGREFCESVSGKTEKLSGMSFRRRIALGRVCEIRDLDGCSWSGSRLDTAYPKVGYGILGISWSRDNA